MPVNKCSQAGKSKLDDWMWVHYRRGTAFISAHTRLAGFRMEISLLGLTARHKIAKTHLRLSSYLHSCPVCSPPGFLIYPSKKWEEHLLLITSLRCFVKKWRSFLWKKKWYALTCKVEVGGITLALIFFNSQGRYKIPKILFLFLNLTWKLLASLNVKLLPLRSLCYCGSEIKHFLKGVNIEVGKSFGDLHHLHFQKELWEYWAGETLQLLIRGTEIA